MLIFDQIKLGHVSKFWHFILSHFQLQDKAFCMDKSLCFPKKKLNQVYFFLVYVAFMPFYEILRILWFLTLYTSEAKKLRDSKAFSQSIFSSSSFVNIKIREKKILQTLQERWIITYGDLTHTKMWIIKVITH